MLHPSSHKLRSEMGRWSSPKVPMEERLCELCEEQVVEDDVHTHIHCQALNSVRHHWLGERVLNYKNLEEICL
eukprot:c53245_g1_i1 orf=138-356(+)